MHIIWIAKILAKGAPVMSVGWSLYFFIRLFTSFVISVSAPVATVIPFPSRKEITPSGVTEGSWALEGSEAFKRLLAAKVKTSLVHPLPKEEGTESWAREGVLDGELERLVAKGE